MVNASIKQDSQETSAYLDMLMFFLEQNNITDSQLQKSVMQYIFDTEETFNKLPTVGKLMTVLGLKEGKTKEGVEKRAQNQAQEVLKASSNYCKDYKFTDPYTNHVMHSVYGGVEGVWKYSLNNPERKEATWFIKEFVSHYINAVYSNNFSSKTFRVENPAPYWEGTKLIGTFTGDMPMLESKQEPTAEVTGMISNLTKNMKG